MTDKELLQEALNAMLAAIKSGDWKVDGACDPDWVIEAIKARLVQPDCVCGEPDSEGIHCKDNPCFMINGLTKEQTNETMSVKGLTSHE